MTSFSDDDSTRRTTLPEEGGMKLLWVSQGSVTTVSIPRHGGIVGRGADADIRIDDASLSRKHARFLVADGRLQVQDLGSMNGTWLAGQPLAKSATAKLAPGESLRLGDAVLLLHHAAVIDNLAKVAALDSERPSPHAPVVANETVRELHRIVDQIAAAPISVLLLGETGVGKEVFARLVHDRSNRHAGPFVPINCPALPESLAESELFGHEKGAFTGADRSKVGLLESAHGGTVFLDEVGDLSPLVQAKLLRVLEDRKLLRVGSQKPRDVDVRFVSATNRDLEAAAEAGKFRQDLFFRLNGIQLDIPPLRERQDEIEPLARHFLAEYCKQIKRAPAPDLSCNAIEALQQHSWPGNIRELRNAVERAILLCGGGPIRAEHLPLRTKRKSTTATQPKTSEATADKPIANSDGASQQPHPPTSLTEQVQQLEKQRIIEALDACAGNQSKAANLLGISRRGLSLKLDKYQIKRPRK